MPRLPQQGSEGADWNPTHLAPKSEWLLSPDWVWASLWTPLGLEALGNLERGVRLVAGGSHRWRGSRGHQRALQPWRVGSWCVGRWLGASQHPWLEAQGALTCPGPSRSLPDLLGFRSSFPTPRVPVCGFLQRRNADKPNSRHSCYPPSGQA